MGDFIRYQDIVVGTGNVPMLGQKVHIKYEGVTFLDSRYTIELPNGVTIDSEKKEDKNKLPIKRHPLVAVAKICHGVDKLLMSMVSKTLIQ